MRRFCCYRLIPAIVPESNARAGHILMRSYQPGLCVTVPCILLRGVVMTERERELRESRHKAMKMLVLIFQLGITMLTGIFLCGTIGILLGRALGIIIIFPVLLTVGIIAGFRSCYRIIKRFEALDNPERTELENVLFNLNSSGNPDGGFIPYPVPLFGIESGRKAEDFDEDDWDILPGEGDEADA